MLTRRAGLSSYWDADGRMVVRKRLHDTASYDWGEVFRYDGMDRLTKMWRDVQDPHNFPSTDPTDTTATFDDRVTYTLGKVYERDNVKVQPDGGSETTTEYTNNDFYQYTQVGSTNWSWDGNGQLSDDGPWAYQWTALGQLHQATPDTGTAREYTYDAFGRRVSTKVGSQVNEYLYHGWHMIGEWDDTAGEWLWQELPFPEGEGMLEHLALDTHDLDNDSNTTEYRPYAVHEDFQSTVWGLSDTAGAIVERYRYREPYGDTYTEDATGTDIGDFASEVYHVKRLHGGVVDGAAEQYDSRNRWFGSFVGSWLSRDPLGGVDTPNLYQFVFADPLNFNDRYGTTASPQEKTGCPCVKVPDCSCATGARDTLCNEMNGKVAGLPAQHQARARTVIKGLCDPTTELKCSWCSKYPLFDAYTEGLVNHKNKTVTITIYVCMKKCTIAHEVDGWKPKSDDLEQLLLHEMWHAACMQQAKDTNQYSQMADCTKDKTSLDKCGTRFRECLNAPAKGCVKDIKKCFDALGMSW